MIFQFLDIHRSNDLGRGGLMNYYEHHIGDYIEATAHLTFAEDAAYARLIRKYYATERPIPADLKTAQRLVGARTKEELAAVKTVLDEFFVLVDGAWHNERCDLELARYFAKQPKAAAQRKAVTERQHRARDRRKSLFEELRALGVVPPFDTSTAELEAQLSRHPSRAGHAPVTRDSSVTSRTRHAAVTASQSPVPIKNLKSPVDNGDNGDNSREQRGDMRQKALAAAAGSAPPLRRAIPALPLRTPGDAA